MTPAAPREPRDTPQNWEALAARVPPRYSRHGDLEAANEVAFATLDRDCAETVARVGRLDALRLTLGRTGEWILLGGLVGVLWNDARRLAGMPELSIRLGESKATPFAGVRAALVYATAGGRALGIGPVSLVVAEDRDEDVKARARLRACGVALPAGPRRLRRPLLPDGDLAPPGGYLDARTLPCKPSHSGSTGGTKGQDAKDLELDVWSAVRAAGLSSVDVALLLAAEVGRRERVPRKRGGVGWELVRVPAAALAEEFNSRVVELEPISAAAMGKRIGRARRAVAERLEERGLVPPMRGTIGTRRKEPDWPNPPADGGVGGSWNPSDDPWSSRHDFDAEVMA